MTLSRTANLMASPTGIEKVDMLQTPTELLTRLRKNLIRYFDTEELRTPCDVRQDYAGECKNSALRYANI